MTFRGEGTSEGRRHGYSLGMFSAFELVEDAAVYFTGARLYMLWRGEITK